jgi:hypothetical protein
MKDDKGLAIVIADKLRQRARPAEGDVNYERMAKDMLAAIKADDAETLAEILEALCAVAME